MVGTRPKTEMVSAGWDKSQDVSRPLHHCETGVHKISPWLATETALTKVMRGIRGDLSAVPLLPGILNCLVPSAFYQTCKQNPTTQVAGYLRHMVQSQLDPQGSFAVLPALFHCANSTETLLLTSCSKFEANRPSPTLFLSLDLVLSTPTWVR